MSQVRQSAGLAQQASASAAAPHKSGINAAPYERGADSRGQSSPHFQPFSWHRIPMSSQAPGSPAWSQAEFAGRVLDVANGVRDVLAIVERDSIDAEGVDAEGEPVRPVVGQHIAGNLMRLCITSLDLLAEQASSQVGHAQMLAFSAAGGGNA